MIGYAPCRARAAYVPAATGCWHWRPMKIIKGDPSGKRAARIAAKYESDRERRKLARNRARENAKQAVDEFRKAMAGET